MPLKKFIHDVTGSEYALTMYKQPSLIKDHSVKGRGLFYIDNDLNLRSLRDGRRNTLA